MSCKSAFGTALFAALLLPVAAQADTIDDFTLTGEGHTITFSLPATTVVPDHPHLVQLGAIALATIDGTPGYSLSAEFSEPGLPGFPTMTLTVPSTIDNGSLDLYGAWLVSYVVIPTANPIYIIHPDDLLTTFIPGTFNLEDQASQNFAPFSLTITPEVATTPEPASLTLLATGALGLLGIAAARRRALQQL